MKQNGAENQKRGHMAHHPGGPGSEDGNHRSSREVTTTSNCVGADNLRKKLPHVFISAINTHPHHVSLLWATLHVFLPPRQQEHSRVFPHWDVKSCPRPKLSPAIGQRFDHDTFHSSDQAVVIRLLLALPKLTELLDRRPQKGHVWTPTDYAKISFCWASETRSGELLSTFCILEDETQPTSSCSDVKEAVFQEKPESSPEPTLQLLCRRTDQDAEKPFQEVIDVSTGDPHRAGIKPLSYIRQVLAVCLYPELLGDSNLPDDIRQRALRLLKACDGGSLGSYTASSGMLYCKQRISEFIARRDGVPSNPNDIFIPAGSQRALMIILKLLSNGGEGRPPTGVLTPLPCPHTLPALLDEAEVTLVPFQLSEDRGWAVDPDELRRALKAARGHCQPRAVYISNPGNPTGHVQDRQSIEEVIQLAAAERLLLLVDEVYQDCVYGHGGKFISYKKTLLEMNREFVETVELFSFHSLSGARAGECGLRAGYIEAFNMDPKVKYHLDNLLCGDISTPVTGQLALDLMLNPPTAGDASYDKHIQETVSIQNILSRNAQRGHELLNDLPGMSCQPAMGGIFLYPRLDLPSGFLKQAQILGIEADVLYCQRFLEEEGVLVGAGQDSGPAGNHHLRLSFFVPSESFEVVLARLSSFHLHIMNKVSSLHSSCSGRKLNGSTIQRSMNSASQ